MFYDQLLLLCKQKNLKPTPFVKSLGISQGNLSNWKNGGSPSIDLLIQIANALNVSVDYLLGNTAPKEKEAPKELPIDEEKLLKYYRSLKEDDKITALGDLIRFVNLKKEEQREAEKDAEMEIGNDISPYTDIHSEVVIKSKK